MNCAQTLNNFRGEILENLVPTFYHYLQFGYYNGKWIQYLEFRPLMSGNERQVSAGVTMIGKNKSVTSSNAKILQWET